MKKYYLFASAIALTAAFASCSNDEVISDVQSQAASTQGLSFSALTTESKDATRSIVNQASDLGTFRTWGFWGYNSFGSSEQISIKGTNGATSQYTGYREYYGSWTAAGIDMVWDGSAWNYVDETKLQYWPMRYDTSAKTYTGDIALDFIAISPVTLLSTTGITTSVGKNTASDGYNASISNITLSATPSANYDLCYAYARNKTQSNSSQVNMHFKHALSQLVFQGLGATGQTVQINSITYKNVIASGGYDFSSQVNNYTSSDPSVDDDGGAAAGTWTPGSTKVSYKAWQSTDVKSLGDANKGNGGTPLLLTPSGDEILLIPQSVTDLWTNGSTGDEAKPSTSAKTILAIEGIVRNADGTYILGSATGAATLYYVFPFTFKEGYKYVWTILFGSVSAPDGTTAVDDVKVYNEDGEVEAPVMALRFTASAQDWNEVNQYIKAND